MTTNTHIAAQARKAALYLSSSALNMDRHAGEILLQCAQALEAAPALDAQGERAGFPPRIMKLLLEVAEREGKGSRGPWEDGDGEPLQEDADAAISWIDHMASAPLPHAVGKPLSEQSGVIISAYTITEGISGIRVERAQQIEGPAKWAVRKPGSVLSRSGHWEWEPMPSSRTDEWLAEFRFDSAEEAIAAAHGIVTKESST